jgi:hypothetical protein
MDNMAAAVDALGSYDVEVTRKALSFLVRGGFDSAIKYIMPLSVHPDVAIRFFAKKAIRLIRERQMRLKSQHSMDKAMSLEAESMALEAETMGSGESAELESWKTEGTQRVSSVSEGISSPPASSSKARPSSVRNHHSIPRFKRGLVVI